MIDKPEPSHKPRESQKAPQPDATEASSADEMAVWVGQLIGKVIVSLIAAYFFGEKIVLGLIYTIVRVQGWFTDTPRWATDLSIAFTSTSELTDDTTGVFFMAALIVFFVIQFLEKIFG